MIEIERPNITVEEGEDKSYAKVIVAPLENGYGITIGNCLRRTLLSALPGAAVQGVKFAPELNVRHEFSVIEGVREDVAEIILNLKAIAVKGISKEDDFKKILRIKKVGPGVVTAGDIEEDAEVEILNKDQVICTLDAGCVFEAEIYVGSGRGYKGAENNKTNEIDFLPIDSLYTPVQKVSYDVQNGVGQNIDKDTLVLEVWTNKTFTAKEVISLAAQIVKGYIEYFVALSDTTFIDPPPKQNEEPPAILERPVDEMDLSVRSNNCLKRANIHTIGDLVKKSRDDMLKVRNFGKKSLDEIEEKLEKYGLHFKEQED